MSYSLELSFIQVCEIEKQVHMIIWINPSLIEKGITMRNKEMINPETKRIVWNTYNEAYFVLLDLPYSFHNGI